MAGDDGDFSELFISGDDDDDATLSMDIGSILDLLDQEDDCEPQEQRNSPEDSASKNVSPSEHGIHDTFQIQNGSQVLEEPHFSMSDLGDPVMSHFPFCSDVSDSGARGSVGLSDSGANSVLDCVRKNQGYQLLACSSPNAFPDASLGSIVENDVEIEGCIENINGGVSGRQENDSCTSFEASFIDADRSLHVATSTDSTIGQGSHVPSDFNDYNLSSNYYRGTNDGPFVADSCGALPDDICSQLWANEIVMNNVKAERVGPYADITCMSNGFPSRTTGGISFQDSQIMLASSGYPSFFSGKVTLNDMSSLPQRYASYMSCGDHCENNFSNDAGLNVGQEVKHSPGIFSSNGFQTNECFKNDNNYSVMTFQGNMSNLNLKAADKPFHAHALTASGKQFGCVKREGGGVKMVHHKDIDSDLSKGRMDKFNAEEDPDVCIIEDTSHPAPTSQSVDIGNSRNMSKSSIYVDSQHCMVGGTRLKACDERNILRFALQDLSQPKSEVSPPDGLLAVPLLRHQRIALSWMVQKEKSSLYCSGGILADDQGLGKTVSTIALILKERPPLFDGGTNAQKGELETLNLDVDDDVLPQNGRVKEETNMCQDKSGRYPVKSTNLLMHTKGRPSAGTLIVCPTSVLRQWAEELHNKVTSQAKLSVLVYHGSNRTKDPHEVAKYDVVLTTYSIVSMEVPKQPLVDKDDEERGNFDDPSAPSRKRKSPANSSKSGKKRMDGTNLEDVARPLAKVAWFRVVLDEAQSIKNHKTQVARACWGLRAKRRWCLSGTPIQNAVDDLYSYFRFLRYDPYAIYTSFCSTIKTPISRSPAKGYRKLQAVLKTIMLRRTKGTLLDGEPIISLPPKSIELRKVDFSREERDFYSRLEADSRAQFQEYADAGTVKQNYVNILLMLLRLRQACDHPLLVKRYNSNSLRRSSVEMAKKLPQEKLIYLLQCLEASLALCGICNDPPEDAVVSVCGHVFCNQCICEHLNGDDNHCPATNCKSRLSTSSVFPKGTLNSCLCDQGFDSSPGCCGSEVEEFEPWSQNQPYESSKIKAALGVLKSLSEPQFHTSKGISVHGTFRENTACPVNPSDANDGKSFKDSPQSQNYSGDRSLDNSVTSVGEKAIVFSQWTRMLDLLEVCLKNSSIQYRRLDGTMSVVARDKAVKDFNTLPEVSVMIMSLKAASLGLNMVVACHVLMLDLWWNPTTEDQAIDRAHRIGQTRPVTVLRLTVSDTVEDRILALQQKKRKMVSSAFGEDGTGDRQSRLTVDDLKYLFMV